jgi:L-alanine-DL-glutamate epimerase-like enolase superfamily enzyme
MYDVTGCGGVSEARKISDMAGTHKIPASPHTGGGPILSFASLQVATSLTKAEAHEDSTLAAADRVKMTAIAPM